MLKVLSLYIDKNTEETRKLELEAKLNSSLIDIENIDKLNDIKKVIEKEPDNDTKKNMLEILNPIIISDQKIQELRTLYDELKYSHYYYQLVVDNSPKKYDLIINKTLHRIMHDNHALNSDYDFILNPDIISKTKEDALTGTTIKLNDLAYDVITGENIGLVNDIKNIEIEYLKSIIKFKEMK